MKRQLYFLHGFAGDVQDWNDVISFLPSFECIPLTYPFELPAKGILIGYSMGGRIALRSPLPKIIISGHPGLKTEEEKRVRAEKEQFWIQKLKDISINQFFEAWYEQPIFESLRNHPRFPSILERRLKKSPELLIEQIREHSLTKQPTLHRNTIFIHGEFDTSYKELYQKAKIASFEIPQAGHACHVENPEGTARQIKILIDSFI